MSALVLCAGWWRRSRETRPVCAGRPGPAILELRLAREAIRDEALCLMRNRLHCAGQSAMPRVSALTPGRLAFAAIHDQDRALERNRRRKI